MIGRSDMDRIEREENSRLFQVYTVVLWYFKLVCLVALRVKCIQFPRIWVLTTWSGSWLQRHTEIRFCTPRKADPKSLRLLRLLSFSPWKHVYLHVSSRLAWPNFFLEYWRGLCLCLCLCVCVCESARRLTTAEPSSQRQTLAVCFTLTHIPPPYIPCGLTRNGINYIFSKATKYKLQLHAQL